ncbi:MAG: DNA methyltransferase [Candidatus Neomarinimicrobiota bacterium]
MQAASVTLNHPITPEWKRASKNRGHPFHPMCSYMAMFPPSIPHYFIRRFTNPGDRVLDPFSGRGTTATEACATGRVGIANDLNPLAYVLSRAKVDPPEPADVNARLSHLEAAYRDNPGSLSEEPAQIRPVFHDKTLRQLVFLRDTLSDSREDIFIQATILGILHGKYRRNGNDSIYLSVDMPNTFSMSPGYIQRFVKSKGLRYLDLDVFENTRIRLQRLFREGLPENRGMAYQMDVRRLDEVVPAESINLVVSSPPYLKVVKYGLYNWIRLWFMGVPYEQVDRDLDDAHDLPNYLVFMQDTIGQIERLLTPGGVCALVIGDVAENGNDPVNLAVAVWEGVRDQTNLRLIDLVADPIAASHKVTKIWKQTRGQATTTDRILVLCKGDRPNVDQPHFEWDI